MQASVSVVMCTYQGAAYVAAQVQSILAQTYPLHEIIILDDASSDNTYALLQDLSALDTRIQLHCNEKNIGYNANFEKGIRMASGEYIAIADQDDIWEPEKISKMMNTLQPDTALIYCDSVRFSTTLPNNPQPNKKNRRIEGKDPELFAMFNTVSGHASIAKTSFVKSVLPFPEKVYYDWWLAINATLSGGIQFLPFIGVYQRMHDQNITIQTGLSEREHRRRYREMLSHHLEAFAQIPSLSEANRAFFQQFHQLWQHSLDHKWNLRLFCFLLRHHRKLFFYKVRRIPVISAFKVSFLFCFRWD